YRRDKTRRACARASLRTCAFRQVTARARRGPRGLPGSLRFYPPPLHDEPPLSVLPPLNPEARVPHENHVLELRLGFDLGERDMLLERLDGFDVDHDPGTAVGGRIGIVLLDHLDDADDRLFVARMIEESELAFLHLLQIAARLEIAHAGPR